MAGKVDSLGKAFGAVVALGILLIWLTVTEREREADLNLVREVNPVMAANEAFLRGERAFYLTWHIIRNHKDKAGDWRAPGETDIPADVLTRHPDRLRIERSWHIDLAPDAERFSLEARRWAATYNRRLAELITRLAPGPAAL